MTRKILSLTVALVSFAASAAPAQHHNQRPEAQRLNFLVGSFEGESRFSPPGGVAQFGRMSFRAEWDLDGAIVKANYEQRLSGAPQVSGHLIFRWRPKDSTYAFEGYANTLMEPHHLTGTWDGKLIFEGTMGAVAFREIWEPHGTDTLVTAMEAKQGERWIRVSESVLLRKR